MLLPPRGPGSSGIAARAAGNGHCPGAHPPLPLHKGIWVYLTTFWKALRREELPEECVAALRGGGGGLSGAGGRGRWARLGVVVPESVGPCCGQRGLGVLAGVAPLPGWEADKCAFLSV